MATGTPPAANVEFRVVTTRPRRRRLPQLPDRGDRLALVFCFLSLGSLSLWPLLGLMPEAFIAANLLIGAACLVSRELKRYAYVGLLITALLGTSECTEARPTDLTSSDRIGASTGPSSASIREATRYQDPRLGHRPKKIDILRGAVVRDRQGEVINED